MKEIKFRAINRHFSDSQMVYFDLENAGDYILMKENSKPNEKWEVMQYTGLKDKNGKEIYEGDLVKLYGKVNYGNIGDVLPVTWNTRYTGFEIWHSYIEEGESIGNLVRDPHYNHLEVIGNIYENPELIK